LSTGFALVRGQKTVKKREKRAFLKNCEKNIKQGRTVGTPAIPGLENRRLFHNLVWVQFPFDAAIVDTFGGSGVY
jgi:hypothetical protein